MTDERSQAPAVECRHGKAAGDVCDKCAHNAYMTEWRANKPMAPRGRLVSPHLRPRARCHPDRPSCPNGSDTCRSCRARVLKQAWEDRNREYVRSLHAKWRKANPESCRGMARRWKYGLEPADLKRMLVAQNNACAICLAPFVTGRKYDVDHDHLTDKVRGLLCRACNTALGLFGDNTESMQRGIDYLKTKSVPVLHAVHKE